MLFSFCQLMHIFVFSPSHFKEFRDANGVYVLQITSQFWKFCSFLPLRKIDLASVQTTKTVDGKERSFIITQNVKQFVQEHFDCSSLEGAELEVRSLKVSICFCKFQCHSFAGKWWLGIC